MKNKKFQNKLEKKNNIFGGHLGFLAFNKNNFRGSSNEFVVHTIKSIHAKFDVKVQSLS